MRLSAQRVPTRRHRDTALGWKLSGAGGGGYLILVSDRLRSHPPFPTPPPRTPQSPDIAPPTSSPRASPTLQPASRPELHKAGHAISHATGLCHSMASIVLLHAHQFVVAFYATASILHFSHNPPKADHLPGQGLGGGRPSWTATARSTFCMSSRTSCPNCAERRCLLTVANWSAIALLC